MGVIINNWGHIITFWGRAFIGGDYHYLGARLLATYTKLNKMDKNITRQVAAVIKEEGKRVCWNTSGNKLAIATTFGHNILVF